MFIYSDNYKRYYTLDYHLKQKFGCKVTKISLNGGFTCPNMDGSKGFGGCTYCSDQGSGDFAGNPELPLSVQFEQVKAKMRNKWDNTKYIAYFQARTNTYAPLPILKKMFEEVLTYENVVGISIATRADCLADDVVEYLAELNKRTYLIVELGLQTVHDITAEKINRCHSYDTFLEGYHKLAQYNIPVCVHIINGLPGETKEMMIETIKEISKLNIHSVKLHLLHVLKDTKMAKQLANNEFQLLDLEQYIDIVCNQIELLPPHVVIQRITGDGDKDKLIGPLWSLKKFVVMNEIDKEMKRRDTYQGIKYNSL
jgi:radical SAM protein (TIGR01212 family)